MRYREVTKKLNALGNFPQFDGIGTRDGLQKSDEGFLAMRTFEPSEKCDYHYIWEYALVSGESDKQVKL